MYEWGELFDVKVNPPRGGKATWTATWRFQDHKKSGGILVPHGDPVTFELSGVLTMKAGDEEKPSSARRWVVSDWRQRADDGIGVHARAKAAVPLSRIEQIANSTKRAGKGQSQLPFDLPARKPKLGPPPAKIDGREAYDAWLGKFAAVWLWHQANTKTSVTDALIDDLNLEHVATTQSSHHVGPSGKAKTPRERARFRVAAYIREARAAGLIPPSKLPPRSK